MASLRGKPKLKGSGTKPPQKKRALRPQKVQSKHELHPGLYEGWLCKNEACGLLIAVRRTRPGSKPLLEEPDDFIAECKCPYCKETGHYRWNTRADITYPQ
jgi:hypothetical protein